LIDVVFQGGGDDENWWALALGRWVNEEGESNPCLAARWNGAIGSESKGNPISRGYPTWFILPEEISNNLKSLIPSEKRALVEDILKNGSRKHF
jgi:hypothetical protein